MGKQQDREKIVQEIKVAADLYRKHLQEIQKFITVHLDSQGIILYMDVLGNLPRARNSYK